MRPRRDVRRSKGERDRCAPLSLFSWVERRCILFDLVHGEEEKKEEEQKDDFTTTLTHYLRTTIQSMR